MEPLTQRHVKKEQISRANLQIQDEQKTDRIYSEILDYLDNATPEETDLIDTMFESSTPSIEIIKQALLDDDDLVDEISDYRNFWTFDMGVINTGDAETDGNSFGERSVNDQQNLFSGGEGQTPMYIALAAAFLNAYQIKKEADKRGASVVLLDEVFDKMDEGNSRASIKFLKDVGLQLIIAAPPEITVKLGEHMDQQITVYRSGQDVELDYHVLHPAAQALFDAANPAMNEQIVHEREEKLKEEERQKTMSIFLDDTGGGSDGK